MGRPRPLPMSRRHRIDASLFRTENSGERPNQCRDRHFETFDTCVGQARSRVRPEEITDYGETRAKSDQKTEDAQHQALRSTHLESNRAQAQMAQKPTLPDTAADDGQYGRYWRSSQVGCRFHSAPTRGSGTAAVRHYFWAIPVRSLPKRGRAG